MFDTTRVDPGTPADTGFTPQVVEATESVERPAATNGKAPLKNIWKGESGLVLDLFKVPRVVVVTAGRKISIPSAPKVKIEDQDRWIDNEGDPDYIEAVSRANFERSMAVVNVYIVLGTAIKEKPASLQSPEDTEWSDTLHDLGVDIPPLDKPKSRYAAWLKYYALSDDQFGDLTKAISMYSGHVTDEDVENAAESFRDQSQGSLNSGSQSPAAT